MHGIDADRIVRHLFDVPDALMCFFDEHVIPRITGWDDIVQVYYLWVPEKTPETWDETRSKLEYRHLKSAAHKMQLKIRSRQFAERRRARLVLSTILGLDNDSKAIVLGFF